MIQFTHDNQEYMITDSLLVGYRLTPHTDKHGREGHLYFEDTPHVFARFRDHVKAEKAKSAITASSIFSKLNLDITDDALEAWEELQATQDDASYRSQ